MKTHLALIGLSETELIHVYGNGDSPNGKSVDWSKDYDYSINPKELGGYMGAGAVTGALTGAASAGPLAPLGIIGGAVEGALAGGIWYTTKTLLNPTVTQFPPATSSLSWGEEDVGP